MLNGGFKVADVKTYKIAVMPGDGTGPEVVNEGKKVLEVVGKKYGFKYEFTEFDFGGERYLKTGETLTEAGIEELRKFKVQSDIPALLRESLSWVYFLRQDLPLINILT
jgi:isocitrate dehydrogenase